MAGFRVRDVYHGSHIFLTGGTGFLGKAIMEKLLWSVDDIEKIYLLIRPRRGQNPEQRLAKLTKDPLFNRLHHEKPEAFEKLIAIPGDMTYDELGISAEDRKTIAENVTVVIHSAATVKFDDHIKYAVGMNMAGTKKMIDLCHQIKHLKVLVHVSTAYANCNRRETTEMIYEAPMDPHKLMDTVSWMDEAALEEITPQILGARPNTYTLTKALAESLIEKEAGGIPVIIVRPSIVGAMWQGPQPGWTDNINGPTGIFTAVGRGILTNMCGSNESKADIIPVDIVANLIIAAASYRNSIQTKEIPIIHCTSGELNPLLWGHIVVFLDTIYRKYPMVESFGVPSTYFHKTRAFFLLNYYLKHHSPALLADIVHRLRGAEKLKKSNVEQLDKVWKMTHTLHFFTTRGWKFECKGMPELQAKMTQEDLEEFNFDVTQVNWDSYLFDYVMGIKRFLLKENVQNLDGARQQLFRQRMTRQSIAAVVYAVIIWRLGQKWKKTTKFFAWLGAVATTYTFAEVNLRKRIPLKSLEEYLHTSDYTRYLQRS